MTPKQAAFVDEYIKDKNATQAAIRAGYSKHTAKSIGQENLTKPVIADAIEARRRKIAERADVTLEYLLTKAQEVLDAAIADKAHAAAVSAIKELGVLSGERIERSERTNRNFDASDLSDEDLAAYLAGASGSGAAEPEDRPAQSDRVH